MNFDIEQVAIRVDNVDRAVRRYMDLGYTEWSLDTVEAEGFVNGQGFGRNVARLAFNYDMVPGKELELIQYLEGPNFHRHYNVPVNGMSHMGLHVPSIAEWTDDNNPPWSVVQEVQTLSHTNPAIRGLRRYTYRIYESQADLGFMLKLIEREML